MTNPDVTSSNDPEGWLAPLDDGTADRPVDEPIEDLMARVRARVEAAERGELEMFGDERRRPALAVLSAVLSGLLSGISRLRDRDGAAPRSKHAPSGRYRSGRVRRPGVAALAIVGIAAGGAVVTISLAGSGRSSVGGSSRATPATMERQSNVRQDRRSTSSSSAQNSTSVAERQADTTRGPTGAVPNLRSKCREAPGLDAVGRGTACLLAPGVVLEIRTFASVVDVPARWAALHAAVHVPVGGPCRVALGTSATRHLGGRAWATGRSPKQTAGFFVCGTTERGAIVMWTTDATRSITTLVRADGDVSKAFEWWNLRTNNL